MKFLANIHDPNNSHYDIYIGRKGHGQDGYFGNPVILYQDCPVCNNIHTDRGDTLPCYAKYHYARLKNDPIYRQRILDLDGKILGCFCHPKPCHGRIILESIQLLKNPFMQVSRIIENHPYPIPQKSTFLEIGDSVYLKPSNHKKQPHTVTFSKSQQGKYFSSGSLWYLVAPKKELSLF